MYLYGLRSINEIKDYIGIDYNQDLEYDIALIDIDNASTFEKFEMADAKMNYFVTSFDLFSLKKGLEVLNNIGHEITLKKILFTKTMSKEENEYLNFLSQYLPIRWENEIIFFPFEMGDQSAIIEGQRVSKILFRNLSNNYKDGLMCVIEDVLTDVNPGEFKRIMKVIEKQ